MEEFSEFRFKQSAVIEFLTAEKVPQIEIHRRMQAVYSDQCVDVSTVRRWVRRFRDGELGQADLSDKTRSGRPVTASDQLHRDRVEEMIRGNFVEK
jgi:transposase